MASYHPNKAPSDTEELLRTAVAAAKSGQRERARDLLMQVVAQDEGNLLAWLWLSGVVDSLDDQEICLENVLALDPGHEAARMGLAWVLQQKRRAQAEGRADAAPTPLPPADPAPQIQKPPSLADGMKAVPPQPPSPKAAHIGGPSTAVSVLGEEYVRRHSRSDAEYAPSLVQDPFGDEYQCPYCAAQTLPDDSGCKTCGKKLWHRIPKRKEPSCWFRAVLVLQLFSTLRQGLGFLSALALGLGLLGDNTHSTLASLYGELPTGVSPGIVWPVVVVISALTFGYQLVVLVGLYLRWMVIFYLYLVSALLVLGLALFGILLTINQGLGPALFCGGGGVLLALAMLALAFVLSEDFDYKKMRIRLCIDQGATTAMTLLDSGRRYTRRDMWAKAAIHFRQAATMMPDKIDPHLMLAAAYINLRRYDLANKALASARRIRPSHPQVERLTDLLRSRRAET
jgi:tetratricopeptide (TPR) repeat protein